ncbi:hypothetical protein ACVCAH_16715 [Micromonospora sp. LZ34]
MATLIPSPPACTSVVSGQHTGGLVVGTGVTCLRGATVAGSVVVRPGAALVAERSTVSGSLTATGATAVELLNTSVRGAVALTGTTGHVTVVGARVDGPLVLTGNVTGGTAAILAGNEVAALHCAGNSPVPVDLGAPNTVRGTASGQCRAL